jgi:UDP-N-acetylglucosamine--N-acetylmuramyl-(pentapeptide) pyrophosphoryl-undecaprenol N-acetylglucosamine transferase
MKSPLRVVLTGGGTGGHVFPALAVANRLREMIPGCQILFVGSRRGLEAAVVPLHDFAIEYIHARGLVPQPLKAARAVLDNAWGFLEARAHLSRFKPDVVVASGGYVSLPVGLAAWTMNIPLVALEQNVVPGKTTKLLSEKARRVCVSFDATVQQLPPTSRAVVTGNPVRRDILARTRTDARKDLGVKPDTFCVLVTGASQGSHSINEAVLKALPAWKDRPWHILHLTGRREYAAVRQRAEHLIENSPLVWDGRDFMEDMASAYAAADLVVGRGGATSLAEIMCRGLPAVLVPYPHAGAHQAENAKYLADKGGAFVVPDDLVAEQLEELVLHLAHDWEMRARMAASSRAASHPQAVDMIVNEVCKAAGMVTTRAKRLEQDTVPERNVLRA